MSDVSDIDTDTGDSGGTEGSAATETPEIRKSDLIDLVIAASGADRKHVKPIVEATLAVLGQALSERKVLNLQPLGKVMVNRETVKPNGQVLVVKIRRSNDAQKVSEGLADTDD